MVATFVYDFFLDAATGTGQLVPAACLPLRSGFAALCAFGFEVVLPSDGILIRVDFVQYDTVYKTTSAGGRCLLPQSRQKCAKRE